MQVEGGRGARVAAAKFRVAAVADGDVLQPPVHDQIDQRRGREDAVRDQIAAEPVEAGADQGADDDDGEADLRIEILADVEIGAVADGAAIDRAIFAQRRRDVQRDRPAAAAALDLVRRVRGVNRQTGVAPQLAQDGLGGRRYLTSTSYIYSVETSSSGMK